MAVTEWKVVVIGIEEVEFCFFSLCHSIGGNEECFHFSVKTEEDIDKAKASSADYILLDQGGGGTGKTFNWMLAGGISRPYFLAGGLGVDNLEKAVHYLSPWAVDLSSSVETNGKKDPEKIRQAVELVRKL